ncbi:hypothetical protein J6590_002956 [Homalodisca vitripennis]|nr:hypothetical protein J6590_002956 [Homalodisca vitripennis]
MSTATQLCNSLPTGPRKLVFPYVKRHTEDNRVESVRGLYPQSAIIIVLALPTAQLQEVGSLDLRLGLGYGGASGGMLRALDKETCPHCASTS